MEYKGKFGRETEQKEAKILLRIRRDLEGKVLKENGLELIEYKRVGEGGGLKGDFIERDKYLIENKQRGPLEWKYFIKSG